MAATPDSGRRVPALLVSGFLGSGKTTLVRHLLRDAQARGLRLAIVSNEFGELGIDRALLGGSDETFVELGGGCVCCRLSDELVVTLEKLREKVNPDRVVIETSGVALPYDVSLHFFREPLTRWIGEDLTVIVVNAEQLAAGRDLDDTFEDQVTSADLIVLNKVDLVPPAALPGLEARLRELEPDAPIVRARHSAVSPDLLFPPGASEVGERELRAERARASLTPGISRRGARAATRPREHGDRGAAARRAGAAREGLRRDSGRAAPGPGSGPTHRAGDPGSHSTSRAGREDRVDPTRTTA